MREQTAPFLNPALEPKKEIPADVKLAARFRRAYGLPHKMYNKFPRVKRKKNGTVKVRWIYAPCEALKKAQKQILKTVLYRFAVHSSAHGYIHHASIVTNALQHCNKQFSIVVDLKDFFPTITREMLRKQFEFHRSNLSASDHRKTMPLHWDEVSQKLVEQGAGSDIDVLLEACTLGGVLPQGAPTSGALANIVFYPLDTLFDQIAVQREIVYTRYADDLTFSGNDLEALKQFVFSYVFNKIHDNGFTVNTSKVHVLKGDQRIVTGLNVSECGVRPARKYRRKLRARLAKARNEITLTRTVEDLLVALQNAHFLNGELGHLWYLGYADGFSNCFNDWVDKYLFKIRDHILKLTYDLPEKRSWLSPFEPTITIPADAEAELPAYSLTSGNYSFSRLVAYVNERRDLYESKLASFTLQKVAEGIRKLEESFKKIETSQKVLTYEYKSKSDYFALLNDQKTKVSYKVKRWLISQVLKLDNPFENCSSQLLYKLFRWADPADRFLFVQKAFVKDGSDWHNYVWLSKICGRFTMPQRFELCSQIANLHKTMPLVSTRCESAFAKVIAKLLHGMTETNYNGFLAHSNQFIRTAALELARYKNNERSEDKTPT